MKEYPEPDYFVELHPLAGAVSNEMHALQPRGMLISVNGVLKVAIVESLRAQPWPPPPPEDYDHWTSAEQAAEYLFEVSNITIAPSDLPDIVIKHARGTIDVERTAFFMPRAQFDALRSDVDELLRMPRVPGASPRLRLHQLRDRPLGDFLIEQLPRATLDEYLRRILCLDR